MSAVDTVIGYLADDPTKDVQGYEQPLQYIQNTSWTVNLEMRTEADAAQEFASGQARLTVKTAAGVLVLARNFDIDDDAGGLGHLDVDFNDALTPGSYTYDVAFKRLSDSKIFQLVPLSPFVVLQSNYEPTGDVTQPATQQPMAPAPVRILRTISQPTDADDFTVTLPFTFGDTSYGVVASQRSADGIMVLFQIPTSGLQTTQFRVLTSAPLPNGDVVEFFVFR